MNERVMREEGIKYTLSFSCKIKLVNETNELALELASVSYII